MMLYRVCCGLIGFSGALFCIFSLCSPVRMICLPIVGVLLAVLVGIGGRSLVDDVAARAERHPMRIFVLIALFAVALRMLYSMMIPNLEAVQGRDAMVFLQYAGKMAHGEFPAVKSWGICLVHAVRIKLFGSSLLSVPFVNFVFQLLGAWCLTKAIRCFQNWFVAIGVAAVYLLSPSSAFLTFKAASEPLFFFFVFASMWALIRLALSRSLLDAVAFAILVWLSIWTRGEGVLLFGALLAVFGGIAVTSHRLLMRNRCVAKLLIVAGMSLAFAAAAYRINVIYHHEKTFFCSNDSYWPRLCGCNLSTDGRLRLQGRRAKREARGESRHKQFIVSRYLADHPDDPGGYIANMTPQTCPQVLVPYIREEIDRRWRAMDTKTMFCFIVRKLWYPFCNAWPSDRQNKVMPESMVLWRFLHEFLPTCVFALGAVAFFRMLVEACCGECRLSLRPVLSSIPCVYMLGMVCVVAIGESNLRYGLISTFLMAYYALEAITTIPTPIRRQPGESDVLNCHEKVR